jgi:hypothetical protein
MEESSTSIVEDLCKISSAYATATKQARAEFFSSTKVRLKAVVDLCKKKFSEDVRERKKNQVCMVCL